MELIAHITAGAAVGLAIGITGVGGGSLMTPLLLMFGYPAPVAIGTDLLYAGITKAGGAISHHRAGNVDWSIVCSLALGSIPSAVLVHLALGQTSFRESPMFERLLTFSLGVMLITTSIVLIYKYILRQRETRDPPSQRSGSAQPKRFWLTLSMGVLLGICVTLSSVGAGAFAAAALLLIYSQASTVKIVGSDIAHAVPLTFVAGLGYLYAGYVDLRLLVSLLLGSLPAIALGAKLSQRVPETVLQRVIIVLLLGLGVYYTTFNNIH